MSLFKIHKGSASTFGNDNNFTNYTQDGYVYFTPEDGKLYFDTAGDGTTVADIGVNRIPVSADKTDRIHLLNTSYNAETKVYSAHTGTPLEDLSHGFIAALVINESNGGEDSFKLNDFDARPLYYQNRTINKNELIDKSLVFVAYNATKNGWDCIIDSDPAKVYYLEFESDQIDSTNRTLSTTIPGYVEQNGSVFYIYSTNNLGNLPGYKIIINETYTYSIHGNRNLDVTYEYPLESWATARLTLLIDDDYGKGLRIDSIDALMRSGGNISGIAQYMPADEANGLIYGGFALANETIDGSQTGLAERNAYWWMTQVLSGRSAQIMAITDDTENQYYFVLTLSGLSMMSDGVDSYLGVVFSGTNLIQTNPPDSPDDLVSGLPFMATMSAVYCPDAGYGIFEMFVPGLMQSGGGSQLYLQQPTAWGVGLELQDAEGTILSTVDLPLATTSAAGLLSPSSQIIGGEKTFTDNVTMEEGLKLHNSDLSGSYNLPGSLQFALEPINNSDGYTTAAITIRSFNPGSVLRFNFDGNEDNAPVEGISSTSISMGLFGDSDRSEIHADYFSGTAASATTASKVSKNLTIKLNGGTTENTNLFTFNGSTAKTINITPDNIGAATENHGIYYGTCDSASADVEKIVTLKDATGFSLVEGTVVIVKFTNTNTATSPTMNVNSTGAKPLRRYGSTSTGTSTTTTAWQANAVNIFVYDGTSWVRDYWYNTTYSTFGAATTSAAGSQGLVPAPSSGSVRYLRSDRTWGTPAQNTAGATNTSSKLFIVGRTAQSTGTSYSHDTAYIGTDGCLYSDSTKVSVEGHTHDYVPTSRTINEKALSENISLTYTDVGAAAASHGTHVSFSSTAPANLAATASAGSADTVARSDHAHKMPTYSDVGAAAASHGTHVSYGTSTANLGTAAAGTATTVSRSDHVHKMPTYSDVGAAAAEHGTHVTAATVKSALGTGTGTSKYLREDGTWATPPQGDITGVTAGSGLTGGGTSGAVTLNVGAGSGITVADDTVSVNTSYTTSGKNYKVAVDSTSGGLYVNVPWTDNNTTYGVVTASANGLAPMFDAADGTINSSSNDWVLTNKSGTLGWYKLPANAFKNDNTTYSVVTSSANGLVPMFDAADGTIDSSSTDWVLTNNNGSIGWYKLPANAFSNTTYSFSNKAATLSWGTAVTIATVGGTDITVSLPSNPNSDTKVKTTADTTSTKRYVTTVSGATTGALTYHTGVYVNHSTGVLMGAGWNDYAEFRAADTKLEPGRAVIEKGDDTLILATERMMPGAYIVSDTYGFAIGETEICNTPIAVTGRVLAYPYEPREEFNPGDAVCTGPNGTVSKMTREEIITYPERILGTVSCVPTYDTYGEVDVAVNGRIWVNVK